MSKRRKKQSTGAMLELWRPQAGAGDPIGCLATTYTFMPSLFDEQCLARFLEIESEPDREDLAFLLERECRLGGVYVGVLVDYTQAGVEHSLRWDVLPVRIRAGKQHAKLSLLAWSHHARIIISSANLTEPGYRTNHEVAGTIDLTPEAADIELLAQATEFLRGLLSFVPGGIEPLPEVLRAEAYLTQVERHVGGWKPSRRSAAARQRLVCTFPVAGEGQDPRSSLTEAINACRRRGGSPTEARIASPFFDGNDETGRVTAALCKSMARGGRREICFCVPGVRGEGDSSIPRLAAPKAIVRTPLEYQGNVRVEMLPDFDDDKNRRAWHAKMLALRGDRYYALMIGSSNFTGAGMGVGAHRNAEANLLTVLDRVAYGREVGRLEAVWPQMEEVADPAAAEWLGTQPEQDEEEQAVARAMPGGFLSATYRAGDERRIILRLEQALLPPRWRVHACGRNEREILSDSAWHAMGRPSVPELAWAPLDPPHKLLVAWGDHEAFLPLNVENIGELPPPAQLEHMSADSMLMILAAADPSAAFRVWVGREQPSDIFDPDLDSATPIDLDPLRRYDLHATFLHRIRRRARVLALLRANLERPVWGRQALEWRLRGLIGIETLAERLVREISDSPSTADEALLTLADFLIVLREVNYEPSDGCLPKTEFEAMFRPFLRELADKLRRDVAARETGLSPDVMGFWGRVLEECR